MQLSERAHIAGKVIILSLLFVLPSGTRQQRCVFVLLFIQIKPIQPVLAILREAQARGLKIGAASGGTTEHVMLGLQSTGLAEACGVIICAEVSVMLWSCCYSRNLMMTSNAVSLVCHAIRRGHESSKACRVVQRPASVGDILITHWLVSMSGLTCHIASHG